jgi:hypothetical protein
MKRVMNLPVAQVIAQFLAKDSLALVVGVEVEVECVDDAATFVIDDDAAGGRAVGLSGRVWSDAFQPRRVLGVVVGRSEIDIFLVTVVETIQILQSERRGVTGDRFTVYFWTSVAKLGCKIRGQVLLF